MKTLDEIGAQSWVWLVLLKQFPSGLAAAKLNHAELYKADLRGAFAVAADMSDAYLAEAALTNPVIVPIV